MCVHYLLSSPYIFNICIHNSVNNDVCAEYLPGKITDGRLVGVKIVVMTFGGTPAKDKQEHSNIESESRTIDISLKYRYI